MTAAPKESLSFVAEFLDSPSESTREAAALALGESRRPDALDILKGHLPRIRHSSLEEVVLLAIATTRLPAALDFLLEVVAAENRSSALAALSALAIHRHSERVKERVALIVAGKGDAALQSSFARKFTAEK